MKDRKTLYLSSREKWRAWLAKHYQSESEIWLIYYKKDSGKPRIGYDDAVEEALCFGWVDSLVKRIDDEKYAQKFTPRRDWKKWSESNKRRMRKLIDEGRMTEAGLAKFDRAILREESQTKRSQGDSNDIPGVMKKMLKANAKAWENFQRLAPSHKIAYVRWILEAKQEATRERRVREAIVRLEKTKGAPEEIPAFIKKALKANGKAWDNFRNLAPSYRGLYLGWIMHAAKEETRQKRLQEAISLLEQNKKLGLK